MSRQTFTRDLEAALVARDGALAGTVLNIRLQAGSILVTVQLRQAAARSRVTTIFENFCFESQGTQYCTPLPLGTETLGSDSQPTSSSSSLPFIVGAVVGGLVILLLVALVVGQAHKRRRRAVYDPATTFVYHNDVFDGKGAENPYLVPSKHRSRKLDTIYELPGMPESDYLAPHGQPHAEAEYAEPANPADNLAPHRESHYEAAYSLASLPNQVLYDEAGAASHEPAYDQGGVVREPAYDHADTEHEPAYDQAGYLHVDPDADDDGTYDMRTLQRDYDTAAASGSGPHYDTAVASGSGPHYDTAVASGAGPHYDMAVASGAGPHYDTAAAVRSSPHYDTASQQQQHYDLASGHHVYDMATDEPGHVYDTATPLTATLHYDLAGWLVGWLGGGGSKIK